ncbi:hypothetical protein BDW74DRAFT_165594 [Aspergillus multicolor]|uniref:ketopantoate reductase family protein n=1 Tax=Aspergillus multicolor TaxID=41759 RepID=UPI003CCD5048
MTEPKARILIVGTGGVGTMAAYALERGGKARATAVLRSSYETVLKHGLRIYSVQYGRDIEGWRPSEIRNTVPDVTAEELQPFDFILVTTKCTPDVSPTVAEIIKPAVTPGKTAIVLSQNGLNVEKAVMAQYPTNPIISSVSRIGVREIQPGVIIQDDADNQSIGPFINPNIPAKLSETAARRYISIYDPNDTLDIHYDPNVQRTRWRKLLYNTSFNSVSAILRMDTTRMRMTQHVVDDLVKPIIRELIAAANAAGMEFSTGPELIREVIRTDPVDMFYQPSMLQDVLRGSLIECEVIVGEPLREGRRLGVPMPTLEFVYTVLRGLQVGAMERRGLWEPVFREGNRYRQ